VNHNAPTYFIRVAVDNPLAAIHLRQLRSDLPQAKLVQLAAACHRASCTQFESDLCKFCQHHVETQQQYLISQCLW